MKCPTCPTCQSDTSLNPDLSWQHCCGNCGTTFGVNAYGERILEFVPAQAKSHAALREAARKLLDADHGWDMFCTASSLQDKPAMSTWAPVAGARLGAMKSLAAALDAAPAGEGGAFVDEQKNL